jgi:hypothetical protein
MREEVYAQLHTFLNSPFFGEPWSVSYSGKFTSKEISPGIQRIGGWLGLRIGLDLVEKRKILLLPGIKPRKSIQ